MTRRLAFAIVTALVLGVGPGHRAAAQTASTIVDDRLAAVAARVVAAPALGMGPLRAVFAAVAGDVDAATALALALLNRLHGPPTAVAEAADAVYQAAAEAMAAVPVYRVAVDPLFVLPEGDRGWDFGPPGAPLARGFAAPRADQLVAAGSGIEGLGGDGGDPLIADALGGVAGFRAAVADGSYRFIVLTREDAVAEPLGHRIAVNGAPVALARTTPGSWIERAYLMGTALQEAGAAPRRLGATGGALATAVDVVGGRLSIAFTGSEGALVSAVILEPVSAPSVLVAPEPVADEGRVLAAESTVAAAVGRVFEAVATAAGPERPAPDDLPEPPIDPAIYRSPS